MNEDSLIKPVRIQIEDKPAAEDLAFIAGQILSFNRQFSQDDQYQPMAIFLRDAEGCIVGGLTGVTFWRWLHIDYLWMHEDYRRSGFGSRLLSAAEHEARRRGCIHAHVETHEFQAPGFYQKQGYRLHSSLQDLPPGHRRETFVKDL